MNLKAIKGSYGDYGRIRRGVILKDISKDRAEKLIASGAYVEATAADLEAATKPTVVVSDEVHSIDLSKLTNKQLHEIAAVEGIAVETDDNKASLVAKIEAGRAAKA